MEPGLPVWTNPMIFVILLTVAFFLTLTVNEMFDDYKEKKKEHSKH
ncbi:hypothetical protein [Alicyclobacillus sp. SO9]|nr:hypothetical protein [Alicyclobacillus sp. SO9]QQE77138.1 hypothetical protein GI364_14275 [Alicyclobacillus sp. SO9]